jgi:hypothetical protein
LPGTNALAYHEKSQLTAAKSFITLAPGVFRLECDFHLGVRQRIGRRRRRYRRRRRRRRRRHARRR